MPEGFREGGGWAVRPPVQVREEVNIQTNYILHILKCFGGMTPSFFLGMAGVVWFLWAIPPDVAAGLALLIAYVGLAAGAWLGFYTLTTTEDERLARSYAFFAWVAAIAAALVVFYIGGLPDTWWGIAPMWMEHGLWDALQLLLALSVAVGGWFGVYWFQKEIRRPYEPTGPELVALRKLELEAERERARRGPVERRVVFVNDQQGNDYEEEAEVWEEELPVHSLVDHLVAFVEKAAAIGLGKKTSGLSRDKEWIIPNEPRRRLSTGVLVTRKKYGDYVSILQHLGILTSPEKGQATDWAISPIKALTLLEEKGEEIIKEFSYDE